MSYFLKRFVAFIAFFLLLAVSSISNADYVWSWGADPFASSCASNSSAVAAAQCGVAVANAQTTGYYKTNGAWTYDKVVIATGGASATVYAIGHSGASTSFGGITRTGTPCVGGSVLNTSTGGCECPTGSEMVSGQCRTICAANQTRNSTTFACEGPCTQSQFAAAEAQASGGQVDVITAPIGGGDRMVQESDTTAFACWQTCLVKRVFHARLGNVTNTSYEIKDWSDDAVQHSGCDVMPEGTSKTWDVEVGRKPDGGCRSGFAYGQVNGVDGCYGSPASGASDGSGGGGPQTKPDSPGGADGAGNDAGGSNQNGAGGACNAGYHDSSGTCVKDAGGTSSGGNGSGDDPSLPTVQYAATDYSQWFDTTDVDQQIEQGKQDLKTQFDNFKQTVSSGMSLAGSPSLPDFGSVTVLGKSISFDLNRYSAPLSLIAQALLVCSLVISAYIVLKR